MIYVDATNPPPPERPHPPCCERIGNGTWCQLANGHAGEHASKAEPEWGPIAPVRVAKATGRAYERPKAEPRQAAPDAENDALRAGYREERELGLEVETGGES